MHTPLKQHITLELKVPPNLLEDTILFKGKSETTVKVSDFLKTNQGPSFDELGMIDIEYLVLGKHSIQKISTEIIIPPLYNGNTIFRINISQIWN